MTGAAQTGLSAAEAAAQLERHGPNVLREAKSRGAIEIALGTLREPMFIFLLAASALYLVVGDLGEGLFLLAGAALSVGLVVFQDVRSEKALAALRELSEPFARVIRDGAQQRISARDLVPGDLVLLGEGERIPADGLLVGGDVLTVDESAVTGESVAVAKFSLSNGQITVRFSQRSFKCPHQTRRRCWPQFSSRLHLAVGTV